MRRYKGSRKQHGLTAAQQKAHETAYDRCDHTIEGNYQRGQVVADYFGRAAWKVATYGICYHEDVRSRIYGVLPSTGPKGWKQSVAIREVIRTVQANGTHEPGSRGGTPENQAARPEGAELVSWTDRRFNSVATCETISVHEGGVVRVVAPIYDDSPVVVWVRDKTLAQRILKLIQACPEPVVLPTANVKERTTKLTIEQSHPRYPAYASARNARPYDAVICGGEVLSPAGVELPRSEYRRIKSELDAAGSAT